MRNSDSARTQARAAALAAGLACAVSVFGARPALATTVAVRTQDVLAQATRANPDGPYAQEIDAAASISSHAETGFSGIDPFNNHAPVTTHETVDAYAQMGGVGVSLDGRAFAQPPDNDGFHGQGTAVAYSLDTLTFHGAGGVDVTLSLALAGLATGATTSWSYDAQLSGIHPIALQFVPWTDFVGDQLIRVQGVEGTGQAAPRDLSGTYTYSHHYNDGDAISLRLRLGVNQDTFNFSDGLDRTGSIDLSALLTVAVTSAGGSVTSESGHDYTSVPVPEPASLGLLSAAALGLARRRRRVA